MMNGGHIIRARRCCVSERHAVRKIKYISFISPIKGRKYQPSFPSTSLSSPLLLAMANIDHQSVKTHPIAPRVKQHHKKPHVGPDVQAYRDHHAQTVGEGSDEWWAKVRLFTLNLCLPPPPDLTIATHTDRQGNPPLGSALQDCSCWWL